MRFTFSTCTLMACFCVITVDSGCSRERFPTAPVSGIVLLNGKPLADAKVLFQPATSGNSGPSSYGDTDASGAFTLYLPDDRPGAVIGRHRVVVSTRLMATKSDADDFELEVVKEQVPDIYRKTPIVFEVPPAGTNDARIEMHGPAPAKQRREP